MYGKLWIFLISVFMVCYSPLFGQDKSDLTPDAVMDRFLGKTGGEKWLRLKSRKDYALVEYEDEKDAAIPIKNYSRIRIDSHPGRSVEVHKGSTDARTILVYKPGCNWYYSSTSQVVKFFGPEPIEFRKKFPRTELMEALNLEPLKTVYIEDTLYRVDFKDARQRDGKQSLFFGKNSGLLYKRTFASKNDVLWEYHFSNYTETQGFYEPHLVRLTSNGKDYFSITIDSILYDNEVDSDVFDPPIPCKNQDDFKRLEFPYILNLN